MAFTQFISYAFYTFSFCLIRCLCENNWDYEKAALAFTSLKVSTRLTFTDAVADWANDILPQVNF